MPTLDISITWILYMHITSGFDLAIHVLRVVRLQLSTIPTANKCFL